MSGVSVPPREHEAGGPRVRHRPAEVGRDAPRARHGTRPSRRRRTEIRCRPPSGEASFDKSDFLRGRERRNERTDGRQIESITPGLRRLRTDAKTDAEMRPQATTQKSKE